MSLSYVTVLQVCVHTCRDSKGLGAVGTGSAPVSTTGFACCAPLSVPTAMDFGSVRHPHWEFSCLPIACLSVLTATEQCRGNIRTQAATC